MSHRIELYKVMISTITTNEQRRQQVTTVNTSLVVAAMAALGGIKGLDPIFVAMPALPLALLWLLSIRYYRVIAAAKWSVVAALEKEFEAQPFSDEWKAVKDRVKWLRFELTHLEMAVPAVIIAASIVYLLGRLFDIIPTLA